MNILVEFDMPGDKDAAAILTAAVVGKMNFAPDADILRDAVVMFRKINRALATVDGKNEVISERRERRKETKTGDEAGSLKAEARRSARKEARAAHSPQDATSAM